MYTNALVTHLADARYDDAIRRGSNSTVVTLLHEVEAGRMHWVDIDAVDFMDIISDENLTTVQEGRINNLVVTGVIALSRLRTRRWLKNILSADAWVEITALARVPSSYAMRAGSVRASLPDVRKAVALMPKSAYSVYIAASKIEAEEWQARALVIADGDPNHEVLQATHGDISGKNGELVLASNAQLKRDV